MRYLPRCSMSKDKSTIRPYLLKVRGDIPDQIRKEKSKRIMERILNLPEIKEARTIFTYVSFGSEVETRELIDSLIFLGKRVGVPLCNKENHTMRAVEIKGLDELKVKTYGILEPDGKATEFSKDQIDVIIVPGAGFDSEGYRIGYGGGYYDRFLEGFSGFSLGLAFKECMVESMPREDHDKRVDFVITD